MPKLNIITFNVNGLASNEGRVPKKRKIFTWLKAHKCDVALLQETHCTESMQPIWTREWGGKGFFSNGTSDSRGVCILIRRGLDFEVKEIRKDDQGRFIFIRAVSEGSTVLLGNVYCPNRDEIESIMRINDWLSESQTDNIILAGDFNVTLDPNRDRGGQQQGAVRDYCRQRSRALKETLDEFQLVDVWRQQNPEVCQFTFTRESSMSRLDYFFVSENLCLPGSSVMCNIMPPFLSDHRAVQLMVNPQGQDRGPGYWKFNNSLLGDDNFVTELKSFIQEALEQNDTAGVSRTLLFDTILCMTRGKVIQYASRQKRAKNERLLKLEKLICTKRNQNMNDAELQSAIEERDTIIEDRTKGNMLRCKVNWAAYAEKSSAYFFSLEKRKAALRAIPALFMNHSKTAGKLSNSTDDMMSECNAFYTNLYRRLPRTCDKSTEFLDSLNKISSLQQEECEMDITAAELSAALSAMKPNTAPGPCGWTAEFFRHFWDIFCPLLLEVIKEIFECGKFPESWSCSVITLIPKKGKDKRLIENLRPISLLPVPYKIIAKAMALRLNKVVGDLIHTDQRGFLKGRYIGENIRLIIDLVEHTEAKQMKGMLMQCDFHKAYDSISWEYINEVARAYGFGPKFQRWISVFYPPGAHSAKINVNNFLSPQIKIERGIRQGCPLSCLIWLLCMEPLLVRMRANTNIKGLTISDSEIKLSAYADDLTVILDGSDSSLRNAVSVFTEFSVCTGLRLNTNKTTCMWIGSARRERIQICPDLNFKWVEEGEPLELLGVKIFHDQKRTKSINYENKIGEIEKAMSPWTQQSLTPLGRVLLVKSLLLSKFVYLFAVIENPEKSYMARLEALLFKFIWGKKDKIKRRIAKKQFLEGGIGAPDVEAFATALKVTWIKRWLDPHHSSWKLFVNERFKVSNTLNIFQCAIGDLQIRNRSLPKFWEQVLMTWAKIRRNISEAYSIFADPLLLNSALNIETALSVSQIRTMQAQNISHVKDLYNFALSRWLTAAELKQKAGNIDVMTCNCLVSKIPIAWRSLQSPDDLTLNVLTPLAALGTNESPTKWAYQSLLAPKVLEECSCEAKWNRDVGEVPEWKKLTKHLIASTQNIDLRWFQFRIWHRILPTRRMLKLFKIIDNDKCAFCQRGTETALHLIIQCPKVRAFWGQIWGAFKRANFSYRSTTLTDTKIMFGVHTGDDYGLNLFLLLAKWFIWKESKNEGHLGVRHFLLHLSSFHRVQSCVYAMKGESKKFGMLWSATAKMMDSLAATVDNRVCR